MERRRDPEARGRNTSGASDLEYREQGAPRRRPAEGEYREGAPRRSRRPDADSEGRPRRQREYGERPVRGGQEGPRRRPVQDGSERPVRRSSQEGPRDRGEARPRRRSPEGYRQEMGSDQDIDRMIQEKYREIEYLESQSRRREPREEFQDRGYSRESSGRGYSREDSVRGRSRDVSERGYNREEQDRGHSREEKPFFSERVIKYIGGIIGVIIVLLVVFVVFGGGLLGKFGGGKLASEKGVTNILLVGQDGREEVEGSRSDSMMLVSVNKATDKVKIISLMRDMYVEIPGHDKNRINASYSFGGVKLLEKTIEQNFGVKINGNVQIDFESFKTIVDKLDGVEIELNQAEADYLNTAYWQNGWTLTAGVQTLTGDQALAYSRIRQVGNSDFERTERQRKVLMTAFRKVKGQGKIAMLGLAKDIYPMLDTDIGMGAMINLGTTALGLDEENIETYRLPVDGGYENQTIGGAQVLVPNMEKNQAYLKELIFGSGTEE